MSVKDKLHTLIPRYAVYPLIITVLLQIITFYLTKILNFGIQPITLETPVDVAMSFSPGWIFVYQGCFATWAINYVLIARESPSHAYRFFSAEALGKLFCAVIFLLMPVTIKWPEFEVTGVATFLTKITYMFDTPQNLFPSFHCYIQWFCFRGIVGCKKVPSWYKVFSFIMVPLVCASVVFVKQHWFADTVAGIAAFEIGYLLSRVIPWHKIYEKLCKQD